MILKTTVTEIVKKEVTREIETPFYCKEKGILATYYAIENDKWTTKIYLSPSGYMSFVRIESNSIPNELNSAIPCSREEFEEQRTKFLSMINAEELV